MDDDLEQICIDDYPEHDYDVVDEGVDGEGEDAVGWVQMHCRRCGAETTEFDDGTFS